jgi:hypothetical protein
MGDGVTARDFLTKSEAIYRELRNNEGIAFALHGLGRVAHGEKDWEAACSCHEQSLALRLEADDKPGICSSLQNLAALACRRGDYNRAWELYAQSPAPNRVLISRRSRVISGSSPGPSWTLAFSPSCAVNMKPPTPSFGKA